ncbi:hypothetical protein [Paenibacillus mucilaginosus]|uniref:DUF1129 family protein n=1 Tax=Paenibacillus mucilaginosus (strain KNP414) TaxID=1036673 RepID=F8F9Y6_PAEMK|nr:hypothetical protein [Paenibacillus mucilaginosus]AEI45184.1 hypothetical protein KNP414_06665 [Paenibacillus mucilaginosus KNP414]MCG7212924.1 hypothetical protein [Paenibacillus mucilaginosus]WDM26661.1 hypothetical protein KCX80_30250 [Paenibacillus mucilaginosus]
MTADRDTSPPLSPANRKVFDEMRFYVMSSLSLSEPEAMQVLGELGEHLAEAEARGRSFEEVFGMDPKAYCEELIRELPRRSPASRFRFYALVFLSLFLVFVLKQGFVGRIVFDLYELLSYIGVSFILFLVTWAFLRRTAFQNRRTTHLIFYVDAILSIGIYVLLILANRYLMPAGPSFALEGLPAYALSAACALIFLYYLLGPLLSAKKAGKAAKN